MVLVAFLVACAFLISVALAVGVTALAIYVGALLAAWTFASTLWNLMSRLMQRRQKTTSTSSG